ncbi:MAG: amino acid adenylation domain-containing protein, partial [Bifidobacteriaceae bacterium]|nr:amino acid adenylation domain-containing protein [Bifidobacteriaceae bacterium]
QAAKDTTAQREYWAAQFADGVPRLDLVTDRPRPSAQAFAGARVRRNLPASAGRAVRRAAARLGATEHMVLLAAIAAVLGRHGRCEDFALGAAVAGRDHPDAARVVGMLAGTVALRLRPRPSESFAQLVAQAREATLGAHANQDFGFEAVARLADPRHDPARNPVFDAMVVFQAYQPAPLDLGHGPAAARPLERASAKLDLAFEVAPEGEGYALELEYRSDLFGRRRMERLAHHVAVVLDAALAAPDAALGGLSMVDPAERDLLLGAFQGPPRDAPRATLAELFAVQAARRPRHPAVSLEDRDVSYRELDGRASAFARALAARGPGHRVAICLPRGADLLAAVLGVAKTGAAWVAFDPTHPPARLAALARATRPHVLVAGPEVPDIGGLERLDPAAVPPDASFPARPADADDVAYLVCTSGTSGEPKAVEVTGRGLANLVRVQSEALGVTEADRVLAFASAQFDSAVWEWVMAFGSGATLVAPPAERVPDPVWLSGLIASGRVTVATLPPQMIAALDPTGLRVLVSAGSRAVGPAGFAGRFANGYGPTEVTVGASMWVRPDGQDGYPPRIPIGRPFPSTQVHVVDSALRLAGVGVPGELAVAGPGLARGYLGRADLTDRAFRPNPFGPGRVYLTGDLGRWTEDGVLEFLGRKDHQVKIRGVRIEPGEVAAAARGVPGVADAAVVARAAPDGQPMLVAYLVPDPAHRPPLDAAAARAGLAERLPRAMLPGAVALLDRLPLDPRTGKVDQARLPNPPAPGRGREPAGAVETAVARAFADATGAERVTAEDDFFALGGDSITAIAAVGALRDAGHALEVRDILTGRTVADLARLATPAGAAARLPTETGDGAGAADLGSAELSLLADLLEPN